MLHAFTGGRLRFRTAGFQLVDLVDEDDAVPRLANVPARLVDEPLQHRFYFLVHIARLREGSGFRSDEGNAENSRERRTQQRLPGAGRADQQDVALGHRCVVALRLGDFPEMRVNRHCDGLLRVILTDHVLIELLRDIAGRQCLV